MKNIFESVMTKSPRKSGFDMSHEKKLTMKFGDLVPIYNQEVFPGDVISCNSELLLRMAPMIAPIMDRVDVYVHYFYVPNRIIWNGWENFITGGPQGTSAPIMPTILQLETEDFTVGKLPDYLGLPPWEVGTTLSNPYTVSALQFRAYQQIWTDYYRDQTLDINLDPDIMPPSEAVKIRQRAWEKDYFTSALPFTQRGPEVNVPLEITQETSGQKYRRVSDDTQINDATDLLTNAFGQTLLDNPADGQHVHTYLDVVNAVGDMSINDLRESNALQRWLEKNARAGGRYIEQLLSHWGVRSSDSRVQRAEYLGGGKKPIIISEVLNTSNTTEAPQGNMSGHGIAVGSVNKFKRKFEEQGWVMGIASVRPKTSYQQGIGREWTRFDKLDYPFPEFAHLGEQAILNKELYFDPADPSPDNDGTWAYQQRFADCKYKQSSVHGYFRNSLDFYHLGRQFDSLPALNAEFVRCDPSNRIFAVNEPDNMNLWVQVYNNLKVKRALPYFSIPSL